MKILHTSDWHIGRKLYNNELKYDLFLFFDWLIETINNQNIDVLIIAGDVFQIAYPSNESLKIYYNFLMQINDSFCSHVFIIGGNHDAKSTLDAPKEILQKMNIYVIGGADENINNQIFEVKDNDKIGFVLCAIPYLRDKDIRQSVAGEGHEDRKKKIRDGIANYFQLVADKTEVYKSNNIPIIATGHLFVNDSKSSSDEERELYIGSLQQISANNFPPEFDYIALGHIHRPQKVTDKIIYSGSPLPMSFSERNQQKSVCIIETVDNKLVINKLDIPKFRNIMLFKGSFLNITNKINSFKDDGKQKAWAEIEIIEEKFNPDLRIMAEKYIETIDNLEVLNYKILFNDKIESINDLIEEPDSLKDISKTEIFERLLIKTNTENPDELKNTFNELIEELEIKN